MSEGELKREKRVLRDPASGFEREFTLEWEEGEDGKNEELVALWWWEIKEHFAEVMRKPPPYEFHQVVRFKVIPHKVAQTLKNGPPLSAVSTGRKP